MSINHSDMIAAAEWLLTSYESFEENDEFAKSCHKVGRWLEKQAKAREREALIRDTMKRHKITRSLAAKTVDSVLKNPAHPLG